MVHIITESLRLSVGGGMGTVFTLRRLKLLSSFAARRSDAVIPLFFISAAAKSDMFAFSVLFNKPHLRRNADNAEVSAEVNGIDGSYALAIIIISYGRAARILKRSR